MAPPTPTPTPCRLEPPTFTFSAPIGSAGVLTINNPNRRGGTIEYSVNGGPAIVGATVSLQPGDLVVAFVMPGDTGCDQSSKGIFENVAPPTPTPTPTPNPTRIPPVTRRPAPSEPSAQTTSPRSGLRPATPPPVPR